MARDMREFFRVLASGWTAWGDWESLAYDNQRDEDYDPCPDNAKFREWLRHHFGLEAAEDPNEIVGTTDTQLWDRFAEWIGPICPDVVNSRTEV
ncbi:hypothetical protein ACIBCM_27630 [Streptomyces sp. NPDC051018]|uniref:hypothetical protein n=1 Tax=Streptomyces sp. NPDC051018 TaxID=3365639 RepID=UPI0037899A80